MPIEKGNKSVKRTKMYPFTLVLFGMLTLKGPIRTAADNIHKYFLHCFSEKIILDISCESSARQRIHMKHQALFSSKYKSKKVEVLSATIFVWCLKG